MRSQSSVHSVARALRILTAFAGEDEEIGVAEIASDLDVHKSTASRLAATLVEHGFLERTVDTNRLRLGHQVARLGLLAFRGRTLIDAGRPVMDSLARQTGETVVLSVPKGGQALDIAQSGPARLVRATTWIGRAGPLHASSDGKVLLAFGAAFLAATPLEPVTPATITDPGELDRELAEVSTRGWATAVGELEEGLNGVAAPIVDARGDCIAALSISGPAYRVSPDRLAELGRRCGEAAADIGARIAVLVEAA